MLAFFLGNSSASGGLFYVRSEINTKGDTINTLPTQPQTSLKIDYFLYSCFEFEQTCKAFPAQALGPQRWPETKKFIEAERTDFEDLGSLQDQLTAALTWYIQEYQTLVTDHKIEMENIGALAAACVYFALDLRILAGKDSNALESLATDGNGLWAEIDRIIQENAPNFAHFINAYLRWVYVKVEEKYWEAGSRPPVGRYTPGARNRRPYGSGPSSSGPRRSGPGGKPSGDRDRGPRRDSNDRGAPRSGGRDRDDRPRRPQSPARDAAAGASGAGAARNSHADQEQAALESVKSALDKLRGDASVTEIRLDPSNSFFRRLQHKKAVSEGFYSFSTGEGNGRSVVVTREKQENEEG